MNSGQPLKFECYTACEKVSVLLSKEGKSIKTEQLQDFDYMSKTANFLIVTRWGDLGRLLHSSNFFVVMKLKVKKGSPRILEWVAYPSSSGSSWPRNWTRVPCIAGGFFTNWAIREAQKCLEYLLLCWVLYLTHYICNLWSSQQPINISQSLVSIRILWKAC